MPQPSGNVSSPAGRYAPGTPNPSDPEQWLELLNRSDQSSAQILSMEIWAIAKTMDALMPGFWGRFMVNRQVALQEFLQQQRQQKAAKKTK